MPTIYSCFCGGGIRTNTPTEDKHCDDCIAKGLDKPTKHKQRAMPRFKFICETKGCETAIYKKERHNQVKFCHVCKTKRDRERTRQQREEKQRRGMAI